MSLLLDHRPMTQRAKRKKRETFSAEQKLAIVKAANRVFIDKFKGKEKPQVKMGLALDISQTSVSALLRGEYTPSLKVAESLATLAGYEDVRDMIGGDYYVPGRELVNLDDGDKRYPNLRKCVDYHQGRWAQWVIAAAQAGYFEDDVSPDKWTQRLDALSKTLKKAAT